MASTERPTAVTVTDFEASEDAGGTLLVTATVENASDERQRVAVVAHAEAGKREATARETVRVAGGGAAEVRLPVDLPYRRFERRGSVTVDVEWP